MMIKDAATFENMKVFEAEKDKGEVFGKLNIGLPRYVKNAISHK